jgi:primosomal protein N' (replication factor Y)
VFADICLPVPFESFTYLVPPALESQVGVGVRVVVPFGKSKKYVGLVLAVHGNEPQGVTVKEIETVLDTAPIVTTLQLDFWRWIAHYYMCPLGDVFKAAFPAGMKKDEGEKKRRRKNIVEQFDGTGCPGVQNQLNEWQQTAFRQIQDSWKTHDITLLHGVTSSGKTEVYIHLIQQYIDKGKQVLYLLPEIALTTQITNRLRAVFGEKLGVYHSKFVDADRVAVYLKQLSGSPYQLILGVRSSVFLPFRDLGLVIVDEEHETSFKQQDPAPRYHARAAAVMLARQYGAKTLLGTATPSIETFKLAQDGRYGYVRMDRRFSDMQMPDIEVVDIKRLKFQKRMKGSFSQTLLDAIDETLKTGGQVILFQNRRGFSSFIECKNCGWVPRCEHCDVSLTFHKKTNALTCHYCGSTYMLPARCPNCEEASFMNVGLGTERIEEQIRTFFPEARVTRMDLDTTRTQNSYSQIIDAFSRHESDILIGTQMVSKGLDFDNVHVVGILDADMMLNLPDFRSFERTFHILAQVAGRSGRKGRKGRVILQTRSADSEIIRDVVDNNYEEMYRTQIAERELFRYPPFTRLIYVYLLHRDFHTVEHLANQTADLLRKSLGLRVLGPDCPPVGRVQSMHIRKIILKMQTSDNVARTRQLLQSIVGQVQAQPIANSLRVYFDVDPV